MKSHFPHDAAPDHEHIKQLLISAKDSSVAIKGLYQYFKQKERKYSLNYICKKTGISSSGYLSDVINHKRTLHDKYAEAIGKAFPLSPAEARYLQLLVKIDNAKSDKAMDDYQEKLAIQSKALDVKIQQTTKDLKDLFSAMEVFCAFGLFANTPRATDLISYFGKHRRVEVRLALNTLEAMHIIRKQDERYHIAVHHFDLISTHGYSQIDYVKMAMSQAVQHMEQWFHTPNLALFEANILSVKRAQYEVFLQSFKTSLASECAALETDDADLLVRLNVQAFPIQASKPR